MRGKAHKSSGTAFLIRITPAYAGKRKEQLAKLEDDKDHPRLCGEKSVFTSSTGRSGGSPPPMRGKVSAKSAPHLDVGITPAYAGKRL